jgi:hypothetical protein
LCGEVPIKLMTRKNIRDWEIVQLREEESAATSGGRDAEKEKKLKELIKKSF